MLVLLAAFSVGVLVFTLLRLIDDDVFTQLIGLEDKVNAGQQAKMGCLFGADPCMQEQRSVPELCLGHHISG